MGTVSNVLNGVPTVSARNAERVHRAIAELGFVPNSHARQLRGSAANSIGMLVLNIANPFFAEVAHAAQVAAEAGGSSMMIASSDQDPARELRYLREFEEARVRGLLVAPVEGVTDELRAVRGRGTPVVLLNEHADGRDFCSVTLDGTQGGRLAVSHLLDAGRRKICFVGGPVGQVSDRLAGAVQAAEAVAGAQVTVIGTADLTVAEGVNAARRIMALTPTERPDGVFAANDLVALGLMMELSRAGVVVPDDIAVVGYDDIDFARTAVVPLTTIAQPQEEIARLAISLIDEERQAAAGRGSHEHGPRSLAPTLVVRASSGG